MIAYCFGALALILLVTSLYLLKGAHILEFLMVFYLSAVAGAMVWVT